MFCNKCGNELKEGANFCDKCGNKIDNVISDEKKSNNTQKYTSKKSNKKMYIVITIIVVALLGVIFFISTNNTNNSVLTSLFAEKTVMSNEKLIDILKNMDNGSGIYLQEDTAKLGATIDINYKNYNKLVSYTSTYSNGTNSLNIGGLILYNTKDESSKPIYGSSDINALIYYFNNEKDNKNLKIILEEIKNYIIEYENDDRITSQSDVEAYMKLGQKIGEKVGVSLCRNIGLDYLKKTSNMSDTVTFLYKPGEIFNRYSGSYITEQEYCWSISEDIANIYYRTNRSTYNTLVALYGEPYKLVKKFAVFDFTKEDTPLIGKYDSLEKAKSALEAEEYYETGKAIEQTKTNNNQESINIQDNSTNTTYNNESKSNDTSNNSGKNTDTNNNTENELISLNDIDYENMTFDQIKSEIEKRGLKVKEEVQTNNVKYTNPKAGTEDCYINEFYGQKGDTISVTRIKFVGEPITINFGIRFANVEHDKGYYTVLEKGKTIHDPGMQGLKIYIDEREIGTLTSENDLLNYTFKNETSIKIKVIAPYIYREYKSNPDEIVYENNIVVYEYTLQIKDLEQYTEYNTTYYLD